MNRKSSSVTIDNELEYCRGSSAAKKRRIRKSYVVWTDNMIHTLIKYVENFECLWNTNHNTYRDRDMHQNAWQIVSEALQLPKDQLIVKWNSIRGNYRIFLKNQLIIGRLGENARHSNSRRENPMFAHLAFLDPVFNFELHKTDLDPPSTSSPSINESINIYPDFVSNNTSDYDEDDATSTQSDDADDESPPPKNPSPIMSLHQNNEILYNRTSSMQRSPYEERYSNSTATNGDNNKDDQWEAFGNLIAANARAWSAENLNFAKRYKAALSAVNAQFELESVNMTKIKQEIFDS